VCLEMSCGARRSLVRSVCGLAGRSWFDSPGLGLAFSAAEETDGGRAIGWDWAVGVGSTARRMAWLGMGGQVRRRQECRAGAGANVATRRCKIGLSRGLEGLWRPGDERYPAKLRCDSPVFIGLSLRQPRRRWTPSQSAAS